MKFDERHKVEEVNRKAVVEGLQEQGFTRRLRSHLSEDTYTDGARVMQPRRRLGSVEWEAVEVLAERWLRS